MLSYRQNIPIILAEVERINPKKVLDIGAGMGKYGLLIREQYLSKKAEQGELEPTEGIIIDAVEDTEYLLKGKPGNRLYAIYDRVVPRDIFLSGDIVKAESYDLILMIDIVEHWEKQKAIEEIRFLSQFSAVLVSTPKHTGMYTEHFYGDPRHHITQFTEEDFVSSFPGCSIVESRLSHIVIISKK